MDQLQENWLTYNLICEKQDPISTNLKLSRGEICVANFIPPANGVSQGNYFLPKM